MSYKLYEGNMVKEFSTGKCSRVDGKNPVGDRYRKWLAEGNTPGPADVYVETWLDKRKKNIADGGYGTVTEQLELIGEQGIDAFQTHIANVKNTHKKPV